MEIFPWKIGAMPRRREGSPRSKGLPWRGQLCLGEPGDMDWGPFGLPR